MKVYYFISLHFWCYWMIKIIESIKVEIGLLAFFVLSIGLVPILGYGPFAGAFLFVFLLYFIRIFISFRHWKISKGISVLNAGLNFQVLVCVQALGFIYMHWPGASAILSGCFAWFQQFLVVTCIFLVIRWKKLDKKLYWDHVKGNVIRVFISIVICLILLNAFDIISYMGNQH